MDCFMERGDNLTANSTFAPAYTDGKEPQWQNYSRMSNSCKVNKFYTLNGWNTGCGEAGRSHVCACDSDLRRIPIRYGNDFERKVCGLRVCKMRVLRFKRVDVISTQNLSQDEAGFRPSRLQDHFQQLFDHEMQLHRSQEMGDAVVVQLLVVAAVLLLVVVLGYETKPTC